MTWSNGSIFRTTGPFWVGGGGGNSRVNSPDKGQWCGALMFSLICSWTCWTNGWENNRDTSDLRCHHAHYHTALSIKLNISSSKFLYGYQWVCVTILELMMSSKMFAKINLMKSHGTSSVNGYSVMMLMKFSDLSQSDCSNWVMWQGSMSPTWLARERMAFIKSIKTWIILLYIWLHL